MDIELNTLRSLVTLISFVVFAGIVYWAWSKNNQHRFEEAANIPFLDEGEEYPQPAASANGTKVNLQKGQK